MSDVQQRPSAPRGRGSSRGARGGYGPRGGRGGGRQKSNGDKVDSTPKPVPEDEGEIGELKKKYSGQLATMKELFPDWTDEDLVFALHETDGDMESTINRISEGNVAQWGEVKKKTKERSRSKAQEPAAVPGIDHTSAPPGRGARGGRAGAEGRGSRGRSTDRGRGTGRGGRGGSTLAGTADGGGRAMSNNHSAMDTTKASIPTEDSGWEVIPQKSDQPSNDNVNDPWSGNFTVDDGTGGAGTTPNDASTAQATKSSVIPGGSKKSWASMFAKPKSAPVPKNLPPPPPATRLETTKPPTPDAVDAGEPEDEPLPPPPPITEAIESPEDVTTEPAIPSEPDPTIPPPKDELTETNLEQVLDTSAPQPTGTQASTVASSRPAQTPLGTGTSYGSTSHLPAGRPPLGGYASSAFKATGTPGRTSSFQRRILEQQEAVVMPNNHAVDRAAVQFGSMGLNGAADDMDADEEREEEDPETRAQPPQHSPVAHPRASLPPVPPTSIPSHQSELRESDKTPRLVSGLPAAPQQQNVDTQQASTQPAIAQQPMPSQPSQGNQSYAAFNRYGQAGTQQESSSAPQKAYDPFGQPSGSSQALQSQYEGYPAQSLTQSSQHQAQQQSHLNAFSSAPSGFSSYYTSENQQRGGYPSYYGSVYGQQSGQTLQDTGASQQRSSSGFGQTAPESVPFANQQAQQNQSRYGPATENQASGHSTPNPTQAAGQQQQQQPPVQSVQSQQPQHLQGQQQPSQAGGPSGYPYSHPYYSNPYYATYLSNQYGYGQGYGAPFGGKGVPYAQPGQGYGLSPQTSYEHSSSPATVGAYGQASLHGRDTGLGGGLNDYGRSGTAQAGQSQQHSAAASAAFGGISDVFGRTGFPAQSQPLGQHQGNTIAGAGDEALKPYSEGKVPGGPGPSLNHPGRADSMNSASSGPQGQSGIPASQSQSQQNQPSYAGYPSHLNHQLHGSHSGQYGGLGGLGGHPAGSQTHQGAGYGSYPTGYAGNYYTSGGRGGGWGGNYGH